MVFNQENGWLKKSKIIDLFQMYGGRKLVFE